MKKSFLTIAIICLAIISQAQIFVGTTIGTNYVHEGQRHESSRHVLSAFVLDVAPQIGYQINDKISIGTRFALGYLSLNTSSKYVYDQKPYEDESRSVQTATSLSLESFLRYTLLKAGRFSLLADVGVGMGSLSSKTKITQLDHEPVEQYDNPIITYGIKILPIVEFQLTKKFHLTMNLDFLQFSYKAITTHFSTTKTTSGIINLGLHAIDLSGNDIALADRLRGNIVSLGVVYKF